MRVSRRSRKLAVIAAACLAALYLGSQAPRLSLLWHLREVEYLRLQEKEPSAALPPRPYAISIIARLTGHPSAEFFSDRASARLQYHIQWLRDAGVYSSVILQCKTDPQKSEVDRLAASLGEEHLIRSRAMYPLVQGGNVRYLDATGFDGIREKVGAIRQWAMSTSVAIIEEFNCD